MTEHTEKSSLLMLSVENSRIGRAPVARIVSDGPGVGSTRAAKRLGVSKYDLQHWRRGITPPPLRARSRLAAALVLDARWLCSVRHRFS